MSHKTTVKTVMKVAEWNTLIDVLKELGYEYVLNSEVQMWRTKEMCDMVLKIDGKPVLGFQKQKGKIIAIGDSMLIKHGINYHVKRIQQQFNQKITVREMQRKGFRLVQQQNNAGALQYVFRRG